MRGFDAKFLEELKSKNEIVDTIGRYVPLSPRGSNFWGRCPFHHEKTASFCVNRTSQFYYCFGCHKSGDVITFTMEIESLDFNDAVKLLADRAKMQLPEVRYDDEKIKEQKKKKERLLNLLRDTALYYAHNLRDKRAYKHVEYIYSRKFTEDTVNKFGMGASFNFEELPKYLEQKGYTKEEMVSSGAVGEKNGYYFDWLGGRLIIPVIDQFNNVVAFDGRRIDGEKEQKYINTKETSVFIKGKTLFNINNLKKFKNEKGIDSVIIVEGHLDVVSLVQAGINNVVASMGTALTNDQARILKRYAEKVYICYDGDSAGQKATMRGLEILKDEGLEVMVVALPEGMDPDDVIKKLGVEAYRNCILEAKPLIDFKIDVLKKTHDLKTVEGKRKFVSSAMQVIRESSSSAEQEDLLKTVRDLTGVTFEALKRELYEKEESKPEKAVALQFNERAGDKTTVAARFYLYAFLFDKPFTHGEDVNQIQMKNPVHREIQSYISEKIQKGERVRFDDLFEYFPEDQTEELSLIAGLETAENKKFNQEIYFNDCIKTIKIDFLESQIEMLTKRFNDETDTEVRRQVATDLKELLLEKNKLV